MPLLFFRVPAFSEAAVRRLDAAACNAPPFQYGDLDSEGVRALQVSLLALNSPAIDIPAGPTGTYRDQTMAAVRSFQQRYALLVDGIAGKETVGALDELLFHRKQRTLMLLDRCIDACRQAAAKDAYLTSLVHQIEEVLRPLRRGNELGAAVAGVGLVVVLVILVFAVLAFYMLPQNQKNMQRLMREMVEAVSGRGEVAREKIDKLKQDINDFIKQAREVRTSCEAEKMATDPALVEACRRQHASAMKAAFDGVITAMREAVLVIADTLTGKLRFKLSTLQAIKRLGDAFKAYMEALNDFLKCLGCPELPYPVFPEMPDFPF